MTTPIFAFFCERIRRLRWLFIQYVGEFSQITALLAIRTCLDIWIY
jgi:hypothetical protein